MTTTIHDSLGVVREERGVEIHATKSGKFAAIVGGKRLELSTIAALVKRIVGRETPIICMQVGLGYYGLGVPIKRTVTGVTKNKQVRYLEEDHYDKGTFRESSDSLSGFYLLDDDAFAKLSDLAARYAALHQEWRGIAGTLVPLTPMSWAEAQAAREAAQTEDGGAS